MSANDPGHIDNLDQNQKQCLKNLWKSLLDLIENDQGNSNDIDQKELFSTFASDNPDVLLLRFLRARKWNVNLALQQLIQTIKWRIDANINDIVLHGEDDLTYEEILTGKTFYISYDKSDRPINYVSVKDHIKGQFPSESTEKITIFAMEIGRKLLKYPNESVTVIFDMEGFSMKNMDYQHVKFLINLLENYYPESLGLGLIVNAPWFFSGCWHIIKPWLDPVVESKIHFIRNLQELTKYIDLSNIPERLHGNHSNFKYIPPIDEDRQILSTIREDYYRKSQALRQHQQAIDNYLRITSEWINGNDQKQLLDERKKAQEHLSNAYDQLIPYRTTKTHYHRNGLLHEPSFDQTYQKILKSLEDKIVFF